MSDTRHYLAFDYGTRKIGVAVGQQLTRSARELATVPVGPKGPDWRQIEKLLHEWQPAAAVVGMPNTDRPEDYDVQRSMARACRRFADALRSRYRLPVHFVDERLSTQAALWHNAARPISARKRQELRDQTAARLILETFLHGTEVRR